MVNFLISVYIRVMRKLVVFVAFMSLVALTACGGKETPVKDVNSTEVSVGAETEKGVFKSK